MIRYQLSALLVLVLLCVPHSAVRGAIIAGFPDAIVCSVRDPTGFTPWEELVFYVSAHTLDGETLYKTLTSDPVVIIVNSEGVLEAPNLADCDGRSINDLLTRGRALFLTPDVTGSRPAAEEDA